METAANHFIRSMSSRSVVERRKHDRFQIKDMGLASLGSSFDIKGKILNIGKLGIAFRYVTKEWRPIEYGTLNILLLGGTWRLVNVPFENIWDSPISYDFSFGSLTFGQCGVRFGELTHIQRSELENFIRYHTTPPFFKRLDEQIHKQWSNSKGRAMVLLSVPTN